MSNFVESSQLTYMQSVKPLAANAAEQNELKMSLLSKVKAVFGDKYYRLKAGTRKAIDFMAWISTEKGFVFASQLYVAKKYDVSARTIRGFMSELIEAGQVAVVYRRADNTNAKGKPVYLFTEHPYYEQWKELLCIADCQEDCQEETEDKPTESKAQGTKKVSTLDYLKKLRELKNTGILSDDQQKGMDLIKESNALHYWKDDAFLCGLALPKKMDNDDWTGLKAVIREMMPTNSSAYGNPMQYFAVSFKNAVSKVKAKARVLAATEYLDEPQDAPKYPTTKAPAHPMFYNWLES